MGEKILEKIDAALESANYYEAHQLYRTVFSRYSQYNI